MKQTLSQTNSKLKHYINNSCEITTSLKGLPIDYLIYFLFEHSIEAVVVVEDEEFHTVYELVSGFKDIKRFFILPPKINDTSTPAGFRSFFEQNRLRFLSHCSGNGLPKSILCSSSSFLEPCIPEPYPSKLDFSCLLFEDVCAWLENNRYTNVDIVNNPGEYCTKGGIIDLFSLSEAQPLRLSFLSENPEKYFFDVDTQMTTKVCEHYDFGLLPIHANKSIQSTIDNERLIFINSEDEFKFGSGYSDLKTTIQIKKANVASKVLNEKTHVYSHFLKNNSYSFSDCTLIPHFNADENLKKDSSVVKKTKEMYSYEVGDYLAHIQFGVGVFRGLVNFDNQKADERVCIEYEDGGKIYVAVGGLYNVEYFASKFEKNVELSSLSKKGLWQRRKNNAQKQSEEFVEELLKNYSERSSIAREPFSTNKNEDASFLQTFLFEDTADQKRAWQEICEDLSASIPMDRLLCGDVGFGKTEIAMRAAFKAAYSGKQVAVLAPTTILASQHFSNFEKRMSEFAITVGLISSFRKKRDINELVNRLKSGDLDIVIGTHALFSDDIIFNNLGLLIIDEEHRFGVKQKEKFVSYSKNIDILTMSATPIPRTLHMALSGIKNISTMHSPPKSRLPIITQVKYYNIETIKNAVLFEKRRGGQVFFVHNSIKSMAGITDALNRFLPDSIVIKSAHGRENSSKLEQTMLDFIDRKIDVLVCTSIIESGIDIPNANTIIINRAHKLGLSQLYQMRGRVGRGSVQAFAYFFIPDGYNLSKNAYRRLKSIEKNSDLGAGLNISRADLEIRGSGTIFGYRQSGGAVKVGVGLYNRMINEALQKHNLVEKSWVVEPSEISVSLLDSKSIPSDYIASEIIRLEFYRKISLAESRKDLKEIKEELKDRYGPIPVLVKNLFFYSSMLIFCAKIGITRLVEKAGCSWTICFSAEGNYNKPEKLVLILSEFVESVGGGIKFFKPKDDSFGVRISLKSNKDNYSLILRLLDKLNASNF